MTQRYRPIDSGDFELRIRALEEGLAFDAGSSISLRSFGAVGNGTTNDTAAILAAFASGQRLSGEGLTYAVSGDIVVPGGLPVVLQDAGFVRSNPQTMMRVLQIDASPFVNLTRVKLDRGTNLDIGHEGESAVLRMNNVTRFLLEDVEITGNGACKGMRLENCNNGYIVRPYIHDMFWRLPTDPGTETIEGMVLITCQNIEIMQPRIDALGGYIGASPLRYYQTDGITFSGNTHINVHGGIISRCMEGSDVSGGGENKFVWFHGTHYYDCDGYGLKFIHEAEDCGAIGCVSERAGIYNFIIGQANPATHPKGPRRTRLIGCVSRDPGYNSQWVGFNYGGFKIAGSPGSPQSPLDSMLLFCTTRDNQVPIKSKYGFENQGGSYVNARLIECMSEGVTDENFHGWNDGGIFNGASGFPYASSFMTSSATLAEQRPTWSRNLVAERSMGRARATMTLVNGLNSNIAAVPQSVAVVSGVTGSFTIGSIVPTLPGEEVLLIFNPTPYAMTVKHLDAAASDTSYKIVCIPAADIVLPAGRSTIELRHAGELNQWLVINTMP